jgi:hypothetical protein
MGELLAFIATLAMQHCPTCRAVFMPARTGMGFCSVECRHLDPRQGARGDRGNRMPFGVEFELDTAVKSGPQRQLFGFTRNAPAKAELLRAGSPKDRTAVRHEAS